MTNIRKATLEDCVILNKMAQEVFPAAYSEILGPAQIEYMMEWMYSIDSLTQQIAKEGHVYFILYEEKQPCGYVSIQPEGKDLFHLQKIYVLPDYQGKGYGMELFRHAIHYIKEIHPSPCAMELNVNRNNRALHFYEHLGMKCVRQGDFSIGNGYYMNDYIMRLDL